MATTVDTHSLISIRSDATVQEAARLMADCSIGALGVLDADRGFAGIITERDVSWFVAQAKDAAEVTVAEMANDFPVVVEGPIGDAEALEQMRRSRVRHLIVHEDDDFRIVSMRDYLAAQDRDRLTARDLMTAPAVACREEAFIEEIADHLSEREISGMPVVDRNGRVVGVVSERDLAYALGGPLIRLALRRPSGHPLHGVADLPRGLRRAKEVMTTPPLTVSPLTSLEELARLLHTHQVNRLPVMERGALIGVVTRGDVLGAVAHLQHQPIDHTSPPILVGNAGLDPTKGMY